MGKKKMICPRIFLPYEILPLLERKLPIYCTFYLEKKVFKNFMYWILGQIIFFFPTKDSIGMLVMDSEGIFKITFFFHLISTQHSVMNVFRRIHHKTLTSFLHYYWSSSLKTHTHSKYLQGTSDSQGIVLDFKGKTFDVCRKSL